MPNDIDPGPVLIADIGGTNTRLRVLMGGETPPKVFEPFKTAAFPTLEAAVCAIVLPEMPDGPPVSALVAAAGPIRADGLDLTNADWIIRPEPFLKATGIGELILLNDFEAQALALPALGPEDVAILGPDNPITCQTRAVIGPGTGLGVGTLVRAAGQWIPVAGEGGHVDFGPRTAREADIWPHLEAIEGRISAEQVLSGDGLLNLYRAICITDGAKPQHRDPSAVATAALADWEADQESQARETLEIFCIGLGRVAGDLALTTYAAGGVYLGGGISMKILPFLRQSGFRAAFEDKAPHGDFLKSVATLVITADLPALTGLAGFAQNRQSYSLDVENRTWRNPKA